MSGNDADRPAKDAIEDLAERRVKALGMGGPDKLAKRKADGQLNARERLDALLDAGRFNEFGLLATSHRAEVRHKTPADGKIGGFGEIDGRPVAVMSNDFTVMGASSSVINGKKMRHIKEIAARHGLPIIYLGESSGARMPDRMGAPGRAILGQDPNEYRRTRETPWISALLGDCYGSSTWYTALSDFVVMRKGATMAVASSRVTSLAINQPVDKEDLGGWRLHTATTGLADVAVDTDEEALEEIRKFLSYLPSHKGQLSPIAEVPEGSGGDMEGLLDIIPESRAKVYDSREVIRRVVDLDSLYELKPRFGKSIVTGLARLGGRSVGIIANNPKFKGGAIDVDAMRKATSLIVLCDSFNIPILFLVDQPGFLIGIEGERRGAPGLIMNWMNALQLASVPKISITLRKNYGQAYLNMGGGRMSDVQASWPGADFGFMDPKLGVNVLHNLREEDDPERFAQLTRDIQQDSSAWALAGLYESQAVIDPRETRQWLIDTLTLMSGGPKGGLGERLLSVWPTSF
jgi:acetyl-CoA carboxylase carboxyltransferase component